MVNKRGVPIGPTWLIRTLAISCACVRLCVNFEFFALKGHFKTKIRNHSSLPQVRGVRGGAKSAKRCRCKVKEFGAIG